MEIKKTGVFVIVVLSLLTGAIMGGGGMIALLSHGEIISVDSERYAELENIYKKYNKLDQLSSYIEENFYKEVDLKSLEDGIYKGLFFGLDDMYSYYMTAEEYSALEIAMSSEFQGIGITFSYNAQNNLVIISTMDDSPAQNAGLLSGDVILMVDDVPYTAAEMDEAGAHIRGKPGTKVKLTIFRDGETREFTITRANIVKQSVRTEMLDDDIAYIRISTFESNTGEDFSRELRGLEILGVKGIVIDLRNNAGGIVPVGTHIADLLLPECTIVYIVDNKGKREATVSDAGATKIPYVVLINEGTASTSEILAGAVKDNRGGAVVGTTSYGKGLVQEIIPLSDGSGSAIKLTTRQYLSPAGNVIHKQGVEPDYIVELIPDDDRDYQLEKAVELLRQ